MFNTYFYWYKNMCICKTHDTTNTSFVLKGIYENYMRLCLVYCLKIKHMIYTDRSTVPLKMLYGITWLVWTLLTMVDLNMGMYISSRVKTFFLNYRRTGFRILFHLKYDLSCVCKLPHFFPVWSYNNVYEILYML